MRNLFKIIKLYRRTKRKVFQADPFFLHPFGELGLSCVEREEYLIGIAKNKRVLHFGFLDSPLLEKSLANNLLLHQQIKTQASYAYGIDIDEHSLQRYRDITGDYDNSTINILDGIEHPELVNNYDVLFCPEVLEHIPNPASILANLRKLCLLNNNAGLCVSVPNAFSIEGFIGAMNNVECVHPDHYFYFSPATLRKLLADSGFKNIEMKMYAHGFIKGAPGLTKNGILALCAP